MKIKNVFYKIIFLCHNTPMKKEDKRIENAKKVAKLKEERARSIIIDTINGMFGFEYRWESGGANFGNWNVSKIAKDTHLSRPTVMKHLKAMGEL